MIFLSRLIRFLFWVVVVSWGVRAVGRFISSMLQPPRSADPVDSAHAPHAAPGARLLVRDPVCGVHLAEVLAIPLRQNGELLHFCSPACRDTYLSSSRKLAANA
jgi:YHS domain-containing protein